MYLSLKRVCLYPYCQIEKLWTLKTMQRGGGVKGKGCYSPDKGIWHGRQTPKQMTSHVERDESLARRGHGSLRLNVIEKLIEKSLLIYLFSKNLICFNSFSEIFCSSGLLNVEG